jgi:superfamily II DNA or RNA helicase
LADPRFAEVPIIGLSATPWRKGLAKHFDRLIVGSTTKELIDTGYLSPFRAFAPASPDLSGVHTVAGDYHEGELADAMNKVHLVADAVTEWLQRAEGRPTLCFAVNRAHAKHLQQLFQQEGVPTEYIDAYTERTERLEIGRKFHAGEIKVVCNVGCLTTGIDWDVRCIILARPTQSEMLYVQMVGRGLRTAEGKTDCIILDHSDNHARLGFVTDIHYEHLDDGKEPRRAKRVPNEKQPKKCPKCAFVRPAKMLQCPCCGFIPVPRSGTVHDDGELIELGASSGPTIEEREGFYAELKRIAETREYKAGWIAYKYKEKYGQFPPFAWNSMPSRMPSPATFRWVQSRNIAWAKSQPRGAG